ncbi:MAG: LysM peptidoglycan-binding domain-containing protein [Anaerolineae bacterium]|nr:LysM peptidoglycan-binding domain-containing protein [Anaerolineae bacterium]
MKHLRLICGALLFALSFSPALSAQQVSPDVTIHVVQRGENLFRIAMHYGMTVEDLSQLNGIVNPTSLQVGQRLLIRPDSATPEGQIHIVQPGETLNSIAVMFYTTVDELVSYNEIPDSGSLYVGQVLVIVPETVPRSVQIDAAAPAETDVESPQAISESPLIHVVARGETLFRIAQSYGTTVNALLQANSISDPSVIYTGQQIVIPGYEAPQVALDLPEPIVSFEVTPQTLVEGQAVRIRLVTSRPVTISGTFIDRTLVVDDEENHTRHTILQGIPIFTEAGIYPLNLLLNDTETGTQTTFSTNLQVVSGNYGRESISLLADRSNLLDPAVEDTELGMLQAVMTINSDTRYFDGLMSLPAAATVISPFGTRRSYNGSEYSRFHAGTDFAGAAGTPVLATASGQVVLVDTLNVRGMATVIDHGWGVFTGYWHQSQQYVHLGDFVTTGQVIGTIGATGRVTGAHLHWELWVGGVPVDPMQWVRQSFS